MGHSFIENPGFFASRKGGGEIQHNFFPMRSSNAIHSKPCGVSFIFLKVGCIFFRSIGSFYAFFPRKVRIHSFI